MVASSKLLKAAKRGQAAAKANAKADPVKATVTRKSSSGNFAQESTDSAQEDFIHQILTELFTDTRHILPVMKLINDRKRSLEAMDKALDEPMFERLPTFGSLPDETKIEWNVGHSNMGTQTVLRIFKADPFNLDVLIHLATQLPSRMKCPEQLLIIEVCLAVLNWRDEECGGRLKAFSPAGLLDNSNLNLKEAGCYVLEFNSDNLLEKIKHAGGDSVKVAIGARLSREYQLVNNFDDWQAHLSMPPLPEVYLWKFFEKSMTGPMKLTNYIGKAAKFEEKCEEFKVAWEAKVRARVCKTSASSTVVDSVKAAKQNKSTEQMRRAREKAQQALKAKKAKCSFSLE